MIKAVVFDMGGVLLNLDFDKCIKEFQERAGFMDIAGYLDTYHQKGFIGDLEGGVISEEEFYEECLRHCAPGTSKQVAYECFISLLVGLNKPLMEMLKRLRKDYRLYLLTNNNPLSRRAFDEMVLKEEGIRSDDIFTHQFYSYEMKLQKPCREIFEKTVEGIGCRPEEILFVDDSPANCAAAEEVGIKTLLYTPGADVSAALNK
ncbi:MAG: HAD family phosphatase [Bacteroidales bacterium]|nr:HAD family phosphatase [Bacteroidales bacterium]